VNGSEVRNERNASEQSLQDKVACNERKQGNEKHDKLRSATKHPQGNTAFFYTLKNKHFIKIGCVGLVCLFVLP
jgi:hypothetical protein